MSPVRVLTHMGGGIPKTITDAVPGVEVIVVKGEDDVPEGVEDEIGRASCRERVLRLV